MPSTDNDTIDVKDEHDDKSSQLLDTVKDYIQENHIGWF